MTPCDVTTTLNVLNLEEATPEASGSRPVEDGITPLVIGQPYVDVEFSNSHESYNFDELAIENFTDNPPLGITTTVVVFEDENGFRIMLNAPPDSEFYQLRWRITV